MNRSSSLSLRLALTAATAAAVCLAPIVGSSATAAPAAKCSACGHNLIKNAGADAGKGSIEDTKVPVPGWTAHGNFTAAAYRWTGGDITASTPGPNNHGKNYFYGGPAGPIHATGSQLVSLVGGGVGGGRVAYKLTGWLGGYSSQTDNATLAAYFENAKGKVLAHASIGPVTPSERKDQSELLLRSTSGKVPAGTTKVSIVLTLTRHDASDDDGMADSLTLQLTAP